MAGSRSRIVPRRRTGRTQPPVAVVPASHCVVVVAGGAVEQLVVEGPCVRSGPRARVDEHGGQGQRRDTHPAGALHAAEDAGIRRGRGLHHRPGDRADQALIAVGLGRADDEGERLDILTAAGRAAVLTPGAVMACRR